MQAASAAGEVSRICAELVFGYNAHPIWDECARKACFTTAELADLEETMPGFSTMAVDILGEHGEHPMKAGPCADCGIASDFLQLQNKLEPLPHRVATGERSRG